MTNGGFVQLPYPDSTMTWEQYKKKYGVDLEEIFHAYVGEDNASYITFRKDFQKPLMISGYADASGDSLGILPNCAYPNQYIPGTENENIQTMILAVVDTDDSAGWGVKILADKTITAFEV